MFVHAILLGKYFYNYGNSSYNRYIETKQSSIATIDNPFFVFVSMSRDFSQMVLPNDMYIVNYMKNLVLSSMIGIHDAILNS